MKRFVTVIALMLTLFGSAWSHGILSNPVSRSSRWRKDPSAVKNYDDNQNYCGGLTVQISNNGKCGLCGDNARINPPRPNELHGTYGQGVIVETYQGNKIDVQFTIENNHLGYVYFELCNLDESGGSESEECFTKHRLHYEDGTDKLDVGKKTGEFKASLVLPDDIKCEHCVLRWTYLGGNTWYPCAPGKSLQECGQQETFKNCADISIV